MIPTDALYKIVKAFVPKFVETYGTKYETRLKTQKLIYLFENYWGENLYDFSWYVAGPYSTTLTRQVYGSLVEASPETMDQWNNVKLSERVQTIIEQIKSLIKEAENLNQKQLSDAQVYELLASILYISKNDKFESKVNKSSKIASKLLMTKPHFKGTNNLNQIIDLVDEKCLNN